MAARFDSGSLETYGAVQSSGTGVTVPDAALLFTGDYSRSGSDLTITGSDGAKFVVAGYFETDTPPSLISPQGAMLTGDVVTSLAGPQFPGMYAQAGGGAASAAKEIGKVQTLEGSGSVIRANGVTETLKAGDPVFEGDVVMTGPASKMGIGFLDGTVFSMSASARMVLNSLVYDPNGSDNSMLFNLVEGSFVFAAGQIAPTGDMKIQTPVATMGIRGTAPTVDINSQTGTVNFSIIPDPDDGHIGNYTLFSLETGQPIGTISSVGTKWVLTSADGTITELEKSQDDLLKDAEAVNQINNVYNTYQTNTQNQQNPQAGPENNPPPSSGGFNTDPNQGENVDGGGQNNGGGEQQQQQQQQDGNQPGNNTPPPGDQTNNDPPPVVDDPEDPGVNVINGEGTIVGTDGNDFIFGSPGDDHITALAGDDFVFAGDGDDTIVGATGAGDDFYDGGEGTDTAVYTSTSNDVIVNLVDSTVQGVDIGIDTVASLERFVMGGGDDTLIVDPASVPDNFFWDAGDGIDTVQFFGAFDLDTADFDAEIENIEIIDLNTTDANTLTISVDDFLNPQQEGEDEEPNNSLQIRGGTTDVVNLTNLMHPDEELAIEGFGLEALNFNAQEIGYEGEYGPSVFEGYWTLAGTEQIDGLIFDIYEFISPYQEDPLAVAKIQQGIQVNFLIESFENGFEPNGWETINAEISPEESTEGSSSAFLSTTTGSELDDPFGVGDSPDNNEPVPRGNAEDIADLLGVRVEDLDDLADPEGENEVIEGSAIQTTFYAMPGQVLSFDWFFTTNEGIEGEYGVVNDIAFVVIDGQIFKLFDAESTGNVEGQTATEGWNSFSIVLGEGDGDYDHEHTIGFGVLDSEDPEVETNLNIDDIQLSIPNAPVDVGYYDMSLSQGDPDQVQPIEAAGFNAVNIAVPDAASLAGLEVLFLQNPSNSNYGSEFLSNLTAIFDAVAAGMTLIIHDRYVTEAESILPGSDGFDIVRNTSSPSSTNIDVIDEDSTIANGPGGIVNNDSLDGGNHSNHGFAIEGSLPEGADLLLSTDNDSHIVTFSYGFGEGHVVYSSIPLDFYLNGSGPAQVSENLREVYAPNVVAYGAEFIGPLQDSVLVGGDGNDILVGGDNDNTLIGNAGNNTLIGNGGADNFAISGLDDGIDTIVDYEGLDALDLSSLLDGAIPDGAELGDVIGQFVRVLEDGDGNVSIGVDTNGETGGFNFTEVAVLQNVGTGVDVALTIGDEQTTVESAALNV